MVSHVFILWLMMLCALAVNACPGKWLQGKLGVTFADCPENIKSLIMDVHAKGTMLPFRRRDFEVSCCCSRVTRTHSLLLRSSLPRVRHSRASDCATRIYDDARVGLPPRLRVSCCLMLLLLLALVVVID